MELSGNDPFVERWSLELWIETVKETVKIQHRNPKETPDAKSLIKIVSRMIFRGIDIDVNRYLKQWEWRAKNIPDQELRKQAQMSIETKSFHCKGGAVYALLAGPHYHEIMQFIIAYQTISDYLDNLCDRSTSSNPEDFRSLHESMIHALTPGMPGGNYYRHRQEQNDGGYLKFLVRNCQDVLEKLPAYPNIASYLYELAGYYCDLQVNKHIKPDERVQRLTAWYDSHKAIAPDLRWYELAACTGSTLGIFCLAAYASNSHFSREMAQQVKNSYFPWVQGLHILLDYLIDQEEDLAAGDLNFCSYYPDSEDMLKRFIYFREHADISISKLPDKNFHFMINRGLLVTYLTDHKTSRQRDVRKMANAIIHRDGIITLFAFVYFWINRRLKG